MNRIRLSVGIGAFLVLTLCIVTSQSEAMVLNVGGSLHETIGSVPGGSFEVIDAATGRLYRSIQAGPDGGCTSGLPTADEVTSKFLVTLDAIPEPLTMVLFGIGLVGVGVARRGRRKAR